MWVEFCIIFLKFQHDYVGMVTHCVSHILHFPLKLECYVSRCSLTYFILNSWISRFQKSQKVTGWPRFSKIYSGNTSNLINTELLPSGIFYTTIILCMYRYILTLMFLLLNIHWIDSMSNKTKNRSIKNYCNNEYFFKIIVPPDNILSEFFAL